VVEILVEVVKQGAVYLLSPAEEEPLPLRGKAVAYRFALESGDPTFLKTVGGDKVSGTNGTVVGQQFL